MGFNADCPGCQQGRNDLGFMDGELARQKRHVEALGAALEEKSRLLETEKQTTHDLMAAGRKIQAERDVALLQVSDYKKRVYQIGLLCDSVTGLQDGFCPDIGEPRDNLTRIKIAVEQIDASNRQLSELREAASEILERGNSITMKWGSPEDRLLRLRHAVEACAEKRVESGKAAPVKPEGK